MFVIKVPQNKLFNTYLTWLNPVLSLSKGEMDILGALLTIHYNHRKHDPAVLNSLLLSQDTFEEIRKRIKINTKLFNKLVKSLKDKGLIEDNRLNPKLTSYPEDGKFKLFVSFEVDK
tara:strand:+ start:6860 stop:7210 length:351 start_codon:yes stop_codon:yes gene_type:complete